jgi:alpha-glucosidase
MLSDSPSNYLREPEAMEYLAAVPTTWDETRVLDARIGEYVTVARRKGSEWYIGSMTNWTARDFEIKLSFLPAGKHEITVYSDGINADRFASDYRKSKALAGSGEVLKIHLAPGGGWAARIRINP